MGIKNFCDTCTHLGQLPSNLVTLIGTSISPLITEFNRTLPDGTSVPFVIPADQVLILTDISYDFDSTALPNTRVQINIIDDPSTTPYFISRAEPTDIDGNSGGSINLTSGIAITEPFRVFISTSITSARVSLHGYLMDFS